MAKKDINIVNDVEDGLVDDMFVKRLEEDPEDYDDESKYEEIIEDDYKETYEEYRQRTELERKANTMGMNIAVIGGILLFIALCIGLGYMIYM